MQSANVPKYRDWVKDHGGYGVLEKTPNLQARDLGRRLSVRDFRTTLDNIYPTSDFTVHARCIGAWFSSGVHAEVEILMCPRGTNIFGAHLQECTAWSFGMLMDGIRWNVLYRWNLPVLWHSSWIEVTDRGVMLDYMDASTALRFWRLACDDSSEEEEDIDVDDLDVSYSSQTPCNM